MKKERIYLEIRQEFTCPLEYIHDIMKGKWKAIIIWRLRLGPTTPPMLLRDINGITEKMLYQHINDLVKHGFVTKTVKETYPLKTEYELTTDGWEMLEALKIFQVLGQKRLQDTH